MVLGASTGYPETRFHAIWGMGGNFDLGIQPGLTYCGDGGDDGNWLCGLRQDVGLDFQVPLRWNLATMPKAAVALRVSPFFRVGPATTWEGRAAHIMRLVREDVATPLAPDEFTC